MRKVLMILPIALLLSACSQQAVKKQPVRVTETDVLAACVEKCNKGFCEEKCLVVIEKFKAPQKCKSCKPLATTKCEKMKKIRKGPIAKCNNCKPFKKTSAACMKPKTMTAAGPVKAAPHAAPAPKQVVKQEDFAGIAAVTNTKEGAVISFNVPIHFAPNKDAMLGDSEPEVKKVSQVLSKKYPDAKVVVAGYTDNIGDPAYNVDLSERRAKSVADAMVRDGVKASNVSSKGYGAANPIADNKTSAGRAKNRRVELDITTK